jgi:hypothetical protein
VVEAPFQPLAFTVSGGNDLQQVTQPLCS